MGEHVILFSECDYDGESHELPVSEPELYFSNIHSIYIPRGKSLTLWTEFNYQGDKSVYFESVDCITGDINFVTGDTGSIVAEDLTLLEEDKFLDKKVKPQHTLG